MTTQPKLKSKVDQTLTRQGNLNDYKNTLHDIASLKQP